MVDIRTAAGGTLVDECLSVARSLDAGFTDTALERMADSFPDQRQYAAIRDGRTLGFASVADQSARVSELAWLAVREPVQGEGIGTGLVEAVARDRAAAGDRLLSVKTLADTVKDSTYARTRAFYEKEGFLHVDTIDPYPGWDQGNPCAIYVKPLEVPAP